MTIYYSLDSTKFNFHITLSLALVKQTSYCHCSCHEAHRELSTVPTQHTKVDAIEHQCDTYLHHSVRFNRKKQPEASENEQ